jgi:hypothetical protein
VRVGDKKYFFEKLYVVKTFPWLLREIFFLEIETLNTFAAAFYFFHFKPDMQDESVRLQTIARLSISLCFIAGDLQAH